MEFAQGLVCTLGAQDHVDYIIWFMKFWIMLWTKLKQGMPRRLMLSFMMTIQLV
uniref:Uncharacterized protein n=1 Tax=Arundo donax TaxID=35708 RepID=A0A0A8YM66_ARUDO